MISFYIRRLSRTEEDKHYVGGEVGNNYLLNAFNNLGLAVDLCALSYQILDEGQLKTAEQQWFMAHCHEYGFILRYLSEKSDLTGII